MDKSILESREEIAKIDLENVLGSVEAFPDQISDAWKEASKVEVPENYKNVKNIVMCGMGGSGLAARIIENVYFDELKVPFVRVNDYNLPAFVDENSLVICSSYSGTTEETVENAQQAIKKNAKWMAISTGNKLIELAKENSVPYYQIDAKNNPSNQPRMAVGYSLIGQLALVSKTNLITVSEKDLIESVSAMRAIQDISKPEVEYETNEAKKLAVNLKGKVIFYIGARHMIGATHTVNNQLNENAKNISFDYSIPELNHHLMEGLKHPDVNSNNLHCIMIKSDLYPKRIQERFEITADVIKQNNIGVFVFTPKAKTNLTQVFEFIQFGAYVNLYLSVLYNQNPAPIPWVDYFKTQLGQPLGK